MRKDGQSSTQSDTNSTQPTADNLCPKCGQPMINKGNVNGVVLTSNPPQWDELWVCDKDRTKLTKRVAGQLVTDTQQLTDPSRLPQPLSSNDTQLDKILGELSWPDLKTDLDTWDTGYAQKTRCKAALLAWRQEAAVKAYEDGENSGYADWIGFLLDEYDVSLNPSELVAFIKSREREAIDTSLRGLLEQKVFYRLESHNLSEASIPVSVIEAAIKKNGGE